MGRRRITMCLGLCTALLVGGGVALTIPRAEAQAASWSVVTLQPLPGDTYTQVLDVNSQGYSVGMSGPGKPVYWSPNGVPTPLPMGQGWVGGVAYAVNDWGLIVGSKDWPSPGRDAVAWLYGTIIPVVDNGDALGVNENGDIVGCANARPFFAPLGGAPQILPTNDDNTDAGCALSVNDWGAIGGSWSKNSSLGSPGAAYPVGRFWYQGQSYDFSNTPQHVTEVSDVISSGYATLRLSAAPNSAATHSALARSDGTYSVLEPLAIGSFATGLNQYGIVVGTRTVTDGGNGSGGPLAFTEPVLWAYGTTVPLTDLTSSIDDPRISGGTPMAISDNNVIVGNKGTGSWILRQGSNLPTTGFAPRAD